MRTCRALHGADLPAGSRLSWRSRSGPTRPAPASSTPCWPSCTGASGLTGSITSWASRRCSTSWACGSPTVCSNRCSTPNTSKRSTSFGTRASGWRAGPDTTTVPCSRSYSGIKNHLLQILALLAMRAPASLDPGEFRDRKAEILRVTRVWTGYPPGWSRRARYTAEVSGRRVPNYADENGVDPGRRTETFARRRSPSIPRGGPGCRSGPGRGKALARSRKEAVITFKAPAPLAGLTGYTPNRSAADWVRPGSALPGPQHQRARGPLRHRPGHLGRRIRTGEPARVRRDSGPRAGG